MFIISNSVVSLSVFDHTQIEDHLNFIGIPLDAVNFFKYEALPNRSYGRFIVYEEEWKDMAQSYLDSVANCVQQKNTCKDGCLDIKNQCIADCDSDPTCIDNCNSTYTSCIADCDNLCNEGESEGSRGVGNMTLNLTIKGQNGDEELEQTFEGLELVHTSFLMSPNQGGAGQDNYRLLIIELEMTKKKYHKDNTITEQYETFDDLVAAYDDESNAYLRPPQVYNKFPLPDVPLVEYLSYIASTHFISLYLPSAGSEDIKPRMATEEFDFAALPQSCKVIFNNIVVKKIDPKFQVRLQSDDLCKIEFVDSLDHYPNPSFNSTIGGEKYFYPLPYSGNTQREEISILIPYAFYDHKIVDKDSEGNELPTGQKEANEFADWISAFANARLRRNVDIIYQGLVPGDLSSDVQSITYSYSRNGQGGVGLRTHLKTIPWDISNCVLAPREVRCKDKVFSAFLLSAITCNTTECTAQAFITKIYDTNILVDKEVTIYDPLKIFQNLRIGTRVYVYRECESCKYVIIQGPCPPTGGNTPVTAACCIEMQTEFDDSSTYCFELPQDVCGSLGGTWTSDKTCDPEDWAPLQVCSTGE
jgi:hypothetical protein